ncbi:transposase [Desulfobacterales bacterium HSG17]|nr:transposase [Desulfobacterales bacterium HSG17]
MMFKYLCDALKFFRSIFSRYSSWILFCMVVLGFIGTNEMVGVTSFCRYWGVGETLYNAFLNFFRASSWSIPALIAHWETYVLLQDAALFVGKRVVLLGDHTYVPKDGRRMPGVVTLRQQSETQSKPSYFRGHCWAVTGLVIGSMAAPYCLPLALCIQLGMIHIGKVQESKGNKKTATMGTTVVTMALEFAVRNHMLSILVLDAFFPSGVIFNLAASVWCIETQQPLLTLIVRAKKNCVGYHEAKKEDYKGSGRYPKYGEKVILMEHFDHLYLFSKVTCQIYGRQETVDMAVLDLLWKPTGELIRFVLAKTSLGPIVLMCSDLNQDPVAALELYCIRIRIEIMIDMLKNMIGAFSYRFWSKMMPKHSRKPKTNKLLKTVPECCLDNVKRCWEAYERFVMLGAISLGILSLIAIRYKDKIWEQFDGYLRTRSREYPSERTVRYVIARLILKNFLISAPVGIMREIWNRCFEVKKFKTNPIRASESKK